MAPLDDAARAAVLNLPGRAWAETVLRTDEADVVELSATGPRLSWLPAYGHPGNPTASVTCSLTGRMFTLPSRMPVPCVRYDAPMSDGSTWKTHGWMHPDLMSDRADATRRMVEHADSLAITAASRIAQAFVVRDLACLETWGVEWPARAYQSEHVVNVTGVTTKD